MNVQFHNSDLKAVIRKANAYGNLILNGLELDETGKVLTYKEKRVKDKKANRSYYKASVKSLENSKGTIVVMWEDHTNNGANTMWKNAFDPEVALMFKGKLTPGYILNIHTTEPIISVPTGKQGEDKLVDNTTLYVPDIDKVEEQLIKYFQSIGVFEKPEPATASAISSGQGAENVQEQED